MKIGKYVRLLSAVAPLAFFAAACGDDPTDEGAGDAFAIVTSASSTEVAANQAFTVTAYVVDRAGTPLPMEVDVTSAEPASVAVDSTRYVGELQETRIYARTLKVDPSALLLLSAASLSDTVTVIIQ